LILKAEQEALSRGCHSAWLDTFEFQARGFYERMGYECFGALSDWIFKVFYEEEANLSLN
jgi:GNAT superfamily N-acetyltransferase